MIASSTPQTGEVLFTDGNPTDLVQVSVLGQALDEIFQYRQAAAYEAHLLSAALDYHTLPSGLRPIIEKQVERMRQAARGEIENAYTVPIEPATFRTVLAEAGAEPTLTRAAWDAGR